jgi:uncharacterized protein involved in exopolysaccharide biosynthesis
MPTLLEETMAPGEAEALRPARRAASPTLAALLWAYRRRICTLTLGVMVFCAVRSLLLPKRYESSVTLMPPDQSSAGGSLQSLMAARGGDLGALSGDMLGLATPTHVLGGMLGSETIQRTLVDQFNLRKVYRKKLYVDAELMLKSRTTIEEVRLSQMIKIRVTDRDPVRARDLAQAYVDALNHLVEQMTTSSAHRERVFLEARLQSIKKDLDASSLALSQFSSKTHTLNPEAQGRAMLSATADLEGNLITAEADLRGLQQAYSPENVRVRSAAAKVAELRSQLNQLSGTDAAPVATPHSAESLPNLHDLPLLDYTYADLYRRTQIEEMIYQTLTRQYEAAKVQEAKDLPSVRILDPPRIPERKAWPPRTLMTLIGALFGLLLAIASIYAERFANNLAPENSLRVFMAPLVNRLHKAPAWLLYSLQI